MQQQKFWLQPMNHLVKKYSIILYPIYLMDDLILLSNITPALVCSISERVETLDTEFI